MPSGHRGMCPGPVPVSQGLCLQGQQTGLPCGHSAGAQPACLSLFFEKAETQASPPPGEAHPGDSRAHRPSGVPCLCEGLCLRVESHKGKTFEDGKHKQ